MKSRIAATIFALASIVIATACSEQKHLPSTASQAPADTKELVRMYLAEVRWRLPEPEYENYSTILDQYAFVRQHRDEMLRTLEIVEVVETEKMGAAFVRYSVGAHIYRKGIWMRKVDGSWRVLLTQYISSFGDDPFRDGKPQEAKKLIKRVEEWEKDSENWWD